MNLIGRRFSRLKVMSEAKRPTNYKTRSKYWLCLCDCGKTKITSSTSLKNSYAKSCGCLNKEKWLKRITSHGCANDKNLYMIWHNMMKRCYDKKVKSYRWYGEKGIKVCKRWHKVKNFFNDMAPRPSNMKRPSLDRVNTKSDYKPSNCRWLPLADNIRRRFCNG